MLKVISLDMDGTLVRSDFVDAVWLESIPALYARQNCLTLAEAKRIVFAAFDAVGPQRKEWYLPGYWFHQLKIKGDWRAVMEACKDKVAFFPEVKEVLARLGEKYSLIVVSNAPQEFVDIELESVRGCFQHIFSCVSHFDRVKKDASVFEDVCRRMGVSPREMCHAGDSYEFDYVAPSSVGINACFVDRTGAEKGSFAVNDLVEFEARLEEFGRSWDLRAGT